MAPPVLTLISLLVAGPPADAGETVVRGAADDQRPERVSLTTERSGASPEEALEALGGLTLLRTGGPLAPVRPEVRGLSGPRLTASLDGLDLSGPSSGAIDLGLVPWVALAAAELTAGAGGGAVGGELALESLAPLWPRATARVGAGTLGTLDAGAAAGTPLAHGSVLAAVSAARTNGRFAFRPTTPSGAVRPITLRVNNDQARASALAAATASLGGWSLRSLAVLGLREGGIPGFASAPTRGVRGRRALLGGRVAARHSLRVGGLELTPTLDADGRLEHRSTRSESAPRWTGLSSMGAQAGAGLDAALPWAMSASGRVAVEHTDIVEHPFARTGGSAGGRVAWAPLAGGLRLEGSAGLRWLSDVGPVLNAAIRSGVGPRWLHVGAGVARASRAPTLEELYAPRGLITGNAGLEPEVATEGELFARTRVGRRFSARVVAFGGRVHQAILLLNRSAFEITPTNTGGIWRGGVEANAELRPLRLLGLEASGRFLMSRLDVTGAPMPVAPGLAGRLALRLGGARGAHARLVIRHRGPTTSNLHGTLPVPGYTLADLVGQWPLGRHLRLQASITNLGNLLTARDLNGLPLPGRQFFASLEATL